MAKAKHLGESLCKATTHATGGIASQCFMAPVDLLIRLNTIPRTLALARHIGHTTLHPLRWGAGGEDMREREREGEKPFDRIVQSGCLPSIHCTAQFLVHEHGLMQTLVLTSELSAAELKASRILQEKLFARHTPRWRNTYIYIYEFRSGSKARPKKC